MEGEYTTSTIFTRNIIFGAVRLGADKGELLKSVGISLETLETPDTRVPSVAHMVLLEEAARTTGNDHVGLHAGRWVSADPANIIYYLFLNSPTYGEGVQIVAKYYRYFSTTAFLNLEQEGEIIRIGLGSATVAAKFTRHVNEWAMATWMAMARLFVGEHFAPSEVRFANPAPKDDKELREFFRAPVEFDHPVTELIFPQSAMDLPNQAGEGDMELLRILEKHIQHQIEQAGGGDPFLTLLREEIDRRLTGEKFDLPSVAQALNLGVRSLQRKLREHDLSYRNVLEARQKEAAVGDLRDPRFTLLEVSGRLGFSSQGAFYKAFHRWYGTTPAEFRRKIAYHPNL